MTGRKNTSFGDISDRAINEAHDTPIKLHIKNEKIMTDKLTPIFLLIWAEADFYRLMRTKSFDNPLLPNYIETAFLGW